MRKQVVEIQCSRCPRKETIDGDVKTFASPVFKAFLLGVDIEFEDLCRPCMKTVGHLVEMISKRTDKLSPDRKVRAKKKGPDAPPSSSTTPRGASSRS